MRDDFQRQTLLDLQDALQQYVRGIGRAVHFDNMNAKAHPGQNFQLPDEISDEIFSAQVLTQKLASRVEDSEIRERVDQVITLGIDATQPGVGATETANEMAATATDAQRRMGKLVRSL